MSTTSTSAHEPSGDGAKADASATIVSVGETAPGAAWALDAAPPPSSSPSGTAMVSAGETAPGAAWGLNQPAPVAGYSSNPGASSAMVSAGETSPGAAWALGPATDQSGRSGSNVQERPVVETVNSTGSASIGADAGHNDGPSAENPDAIVMDFSEGVAGEATSRTATSQPESKTHDETADIENDRIAATAEGEGDGNYEAMEDDDDECFRYNDADIQRDAAEQHVALLVHISLAFFAFVFLCALVGSILLVSQYGFLTVLIIMALVTLVGGSGYFVTKAIFSDKQLKPIRRKMKRWRAVAEAVVVKELRNLQLDINDHLLLENGNGDYDEDEDEEEQENEEKQTGDDAERDGPDAATQRTEGNRINKSTSVGETKKKKKYDGKPRSMLFGLVKPFIKPKGTRKKKLFGRKKKKGKKGGESTVPAADGYIPPAADATMA